MTMTKPDDSGLPWHDGERAVQARLGVTAKADNRGRWMIRSEIVQEQQWFLAELPFVVIGAHDLQGWPWASLLASAPGFATASHAQGVRLAATPFAGDPLATAEGEALAEGSAVGLLGIDPLTRMRLRINGRVTGAADGGISLRIDQCYGNCPAYITPRKLVMAADGGSIAFDGTTVDDAARALIGRCDTAFVASSSPPAAGAAGTGSGADVSHRGGPAGFVRVEDDGALTVPDYTGNDMYNTLGNLAAWPRAGLTFMDAGGGGLLQVTGTTEIIWEGPEIADFPKAKRLWRLTPHRVVRREGVFTPLA